MASAREPGPQPLRRPRPSDALQDTVTITLTCNWPATNLVFLREPIPVSTVYEYSCLCFKNRVESPSTSRAYVHWIHAAEV